MTRQEKIQKQIDEAHRVLNRYYKGKVNGMNCVITANRLSNKAKKEYFGFHFEPENSKKIGDVIAWGDQSISTVLHII